ncbi:MAG: chromate transporter [Bacillota bacterium]
MLRFFLLVVGLTALSFGGGTTLMAGLERELVQTGVISAEEFAVAVALGQSTPGPLAAFTTAIGMAAGGLGSAVAATLALILVSLGAVFLIARVPPAWFRLPPVKAGLEAVGPLVTVIVLYLAGRILLTAGGGLHGLGLLITGVVVAGRLYKLPTAPLMLAAVLVGMLAG